METLKFRDYLIPLVLSGEKTSTWRLFDDKNISVGDKVNLQEFVTSRSFGDAAIVEVIEKPFGELTTNDKKGHESFETNEEMYRTYSKYYKTEVNQSTPLKIIRFKLVD